MRDSFTLLIPTYNRPSLLRRLLSYMTAQRFDYPITIADSSSSNVLKENEETIHNSKLQINHRRFEPSIEVFNKIIAALSEISSEYVGFCSDDDFLAAHAVSRAVDFLDAHAEYAAAEGLSVTCNVQQNRLRTLPFPQHPIEDATAAERLSHYVSDPTSHFYAIHRRTVLIETFNCISKNRTDNTRFEELMLSSLTAIRGKIAVVEGLHLVRQMSGHRDDSGSRQTGGWKQVLASQTFEANRARFLSALESALTDAGLNATEATTCAERGFNTYLAGLSRTVRDTKRERLICATLVPSAPTKTRRALQKMIGTVALLDPRIRRLRKEFKPIAMLLNKYPDGIVQHV